MKKYFFGGFIIICIVAGSLWKYQQIKSNETVSKSPDNVTNNSNTLPDSQQLTEMVKEAANTDMTPEEYKEATSFKVAYPTFGTVLVPGQSYTATWVAGKMTKAPSYKVRLIDSTYQFDTTLGTADESTGKFSFVVPDMNGKQYEKYQLVFNNSSTSYNSGGTSDYFYIKNTTTKTVNTENPGTSNSAGHTPTVLFTVSADFPNGETKITVNPGDWANYEWSSKDADTVTETYSTIGCKDPKSNETRAPRTIEVSGKESFKINNYLAGCTVSRTILVKNIKTGQQSFATTVVTVK